MYSVCENNLIIIRRRRKGRKREKENDDDDDNVGKGKWRRVKKKETEVLFRHLSKIL